MSFSLSFFFGFNTLLFRREFTNTDDYSEYVSFVRVFKTLAGRFYLIEVFILTMTLIEYSVSRRDDHVRSLSKNDTLLYSRNSCGAGDLTVLRGCAIFRNHGAFKSREGDFYFCLTACRARTLRKLFPPQGETAPFPPPPSFLTKQLARSLAPTISHRERRARRKRGRWLKI